MSPGTPVLALVQMAVALPPHTVAPSPLQPPLVSPLNGAARELMAAPTAGGNSGHANASQGVPTSMTPAATTKKTSGLGTKLACGAIAGVVGTSVIFPIDLVKTRLQNNRSIAASSAATLTSSASPSQTSGIALAKTIVRAEGVRGLYRGLAANLVGVTPEKAIKLGVNDFAREYWARRIGCDVDALPLLYGMVAGATAGSCQILATTPMEMVKIQMQTLSQLPDGAGKNKSTLAVVRELGIRGMYRGSLATLLRDVPFSFMFFPGFALAKSMLGAETPAKTFAAGIVSATIAAYLATPMDVVKTRLQARPRPGEPVYTGVAEAYVTIWRKEGLQAFFKGATQRCLIIAPLFGISMLVYEVQQKLMQ